MKKIGSFLRICKVSAAVVILLNVMAPAWADGAARSFVDMVKELPLVPVGTQDSEVLNKVTVAVNLIKRLELPKAHLAINEALQLDPRNSHLHFLNGFIYHLQARQGDSQKSELAMEGYQQAIRIDPGNWIAREFLGLAFMDLKQFDNARLAFSEVLLMTPESSVSIYGMMVSSYLTGDARTACSMADQFQKTTKDADRMFVRSSISVYAACGDFVQADRMRDTFKQISGGGPEVERVDQRLAQWKSVYSKLKQDQQHKVSAPVSDSQAGNGMVRTSLSQLPPNGRPEEIAQAFTMPSSLSRPENRPAPAVASPAASQASVQQAAPAQALASTQMASNDVSSGGPRMILIDVVLLSTQELMSTSKGVNLLNALTLQLGSVTGNVAAYSRVISSTVASGAAATASTAITRAVTIPALSYSLNIANANNSINEVLARPTLAAIEGLPSEFFSGTNLSAGVVSLSQQGGTTVVPLDKRFGIKLAVTPSFLGEGRVQLKVDAQRTSLNATVDNPKVAYQIEIAEITANANVVMNLGETLVLSGLSEKISTSTRDGVPGLQDLPVVQYLFSNQKKDEIQRSVLILVTPRAPVKISETAAGTVDPLASQTKALREKFGFSQTTPANAEAILAQLQSNEFFREFRQGDVLMERWERMRSTGDRLKEALGFLYY